MDMTASALFDASWRRLVAKVREEGRQLRAPREVVWLNGAPGSGKGANTPFIIRSRPVKMKAVSMSQVVSSLPSAKDAINTGALVPDAPILDSLLESLMTPPPQSREGEPYGVLVDGFPRTPLQVDCVKLLHDKLMDVSARHALLPASAGGYRFPRPRFRCVILYVDEQTSVDRQLHRGRQAAVKSQRAIDAIDGQAEQLPDYMRPRSTDTSEVAARRRYATFKEHYATLLRLKRYFPFTLIDAMGSLNECEAQIVRELRYQSSLELDEGTFDAIRPIPIASAIANRARQQLVSRLDGYYNTNREVFLEVVGILNKDVVPLLKRGSLAGLATYITTNPLFNNPDVCTSDDDGGVICSSIVPGNSDSEAVRMFMDVLADRGYAASHKIEVKRWPIRVDIKTGQIFNKESRQHLFRIEFARAEIREQQPTTQAVALSLSPTASDIGGQVEEDDDSGSRGPPAGAGPGSGARATSKKRKGNTEDDFDLHFGYD